MTNRPCSREGARVLHPTLQRKSNTRKRLPQSHGARKQHNFSEGPSASQHPLRPHRSLQHEADAHPAPQEHRHAPREGPRRRGETQTARPFRLRRQSPLPLGDTESPLQSDSTGGHPGGPAARITHLSALSDRRRYRETSLGQKSINVQTFLKVRAYAHTTSSLEPTKLSRVPQIQHDHQRGEQKVT